MTSKPGHLAVWVAIRALFRVVNRYVGNLAPMPGVFPDYPAPVVRNVGTEREMTMMRWGMPPPPRTGGPPVTNIRNTSSPHWRGWLKHHDPQVTHVSDSPTAAGIQPQPLVEDKSVETRATAKGAGFLAAPAASGPSRGYLLTGITALNAESPAGVMQ
jgi:hypothetical protein